MHLKTSIAYYFLLKYSTHYKTIIFFIFLKIHSIYLKSKLNAKRLIIILYTDSQKTICLQNNNFDSARNVKSFNKPQIFSWILCGENMGNLLATLLAAYWVSYDVTYVPELELKSHAYDSGNELSNCL